MLQALLAAEKKTSTGHYLNNVTGLRAVAVLWVLIYHTWGVSAGPRVTIPLPAGANLGLSSIFKMGFLGVDIFFVISGFLLTLPWLKPRQDSNFINLIRSFYTRRILRITPAYYTILLVMLYLSLFGFQKIPTTGNIVSHLFFLNDFLNQAIIRGVFWTLSVEMSFYLVLPLIMHTRKSKYWTITVGLMAVSAIVFRIVLIYQYHPEFNTGEAVNFNNVRYIHTLAGRFDEFAIGMVCAYLYHEKRIPKNWGNALFTFGIVVLFVIVNIYARKGDILREAPIGYVILPTMIAIAAGLIISGAVVGGPLPNRILGSSTMIFIGTISYSVYLWHTIVLDALYQAELLNAVQGITRLIYAFLYSVVPIILLSSISYWWIERPFLEIRHNLNNNATATFIERKPLIAVLGAAVIIGVTALYLNLLVRGSP